MISSFLEEELGIIKYIPLVNNSVKSAKSFFINKALPDPIGLLSYPFMLWARIFLIILIELLMMY